MEDEKGVVAPVTRRRRRLSVEQSDEIKATSTPNTPNKKRGGRLAAKPELDLIDENAPENNTSKRLTRKTAVKEIEAIDEKPVTPSRRSARIKSNSSLVLEATQPVESPRAKRALRRTSQVGSDTEAPITPARQTRRTRKDSVSNAENVESQPADNPTTPKIEIIAEEPESTSPKSENNLDNIPTPRRKSPRLNKKNTSNDLIDLDNTSKNDILNNKESSIEEHNNSNKENEINEDTASKDVSVVIKENNLNKVEKAILSESTSDLLKELQTNPKKKLHILNKSSSAVLDTQSFKSKRQRTKSWTTLCEPLKTDNLCYSDSEMHTKIKRKSSQNNSSNNEISTNLQNNSLNASINEKRKRIHDESVKDVNSPDKKEILTANTIENPDLSIHKIVDDGDQCVPTIVSDCVTEDTFSQKIQNNFNSSNANLEISHKQIENKNDSCEPMDIDETITDVVVVENKDLDKDQVIELNASQENKIRKLSLTLSSSQNLDIIGKATQVSTPKVLSKPNRTLDETQDNELDKKNNTLNCMTSTPLQPKNFIKQATQVNTSGITSKIDNSYDDSKINKSKKSNTSSEPLEDEDSNEESLLEKSTFVDDEADEASDNYESGDSRDEDEERYEKENEIIEMGETLTSEDDLSTDIDYEKDSFVVSSDEEDNELLDVSGDDLSMSSNELKMTAKSKKKYNERKAKEQKKASKEMFDSRHKLNVSSDSIKSKSMKLKKKRVLIDSSDSDDSIIQVKKNNNRLKLDSSHDTSMNKLNSSHETSVNKSLGTNSKIQNEETLSKSKENESIMNEIEMSVCGTTKDEVDPLSVEIKNEPKTPQNNKANLSFEFKDLNHSLQNENGNQSTTKKAPIKNPLNDSEPSDSSDSSDNEHIQNYDSILTDLNRNIRNKVIKDSDSSLNLDKKTKKTKTEPIVEQLNLTQIKTKQHKTKKSADMSKTEKSSNAKSNKSLSEKTTTSTYDDKSSNSIDLNLLFSEESSESLLAKDNSNECEIGEEDNFIPLKESKGKTNILVTSEDDNDVQFFIDTTGTHDSKRSEKSFNENAAKDKIEQEGNSDSDTPMEIPNKSIQVDQDDEDLGDEKILNKSLAKRKSITKTPKSDKKRKNKSLSDALTPEVVANKSINESVITTPKSEKKKKNKVPECQSEELISAADHSINKSQAKTPNSAKKKQKLKSLPTEPLNQKSTSEVEVELSEKSYIEKQGDSDVEKPRKTPKSDKKKKRLSESLVIEQSDENPTNNAEISDEVSNKNYSQKQINEFEADDKHIDGEKNLKTPKSDKKKKRRSQSLVIEQTDHKHDSTMSPGILNKSLSEIQNEQANNDNGKNIKTPKSDKKKKRLSESVVIEQSDENPTNNAEISDEVSNKNYSQKQINEVEADEKHIDGEKNLKTPKSDKKKKRRSQSLVIEQIDHKHDPTISPDILNKSLSEIQNEQANNDNGKNIKTPKSDKRNKKISESLVIEQTEVAVEVQTKSLSQNQDEQAIINKESVLKTPKSNKKKKKQLETLVIEQTEITVEAPNKSILEKQEVKACIDKEKVIKSPKTDKKKKNRSETLQIDQTVNVAERSDVVIPKNRKRKSPPDMDQEKDILTEDISKTLNEPMTNETRKKRRKVTQTIENSENVTQGITKKLHGPKKRKEREEDEGNKMAKVQKIDSFDKVYVPRLPMSVLNKLEDKPNKKKQTVTKTKVISTSSFVVEETKKLKAKPSNYLEESIYLNENESLNSKIEKHIKNPKVLPFIPTASTSDKGYTTNFKVSVIPKEVKFVAKSSDVSNYKNDYLQNKKMKRMGTYELYKKNRNIKMSKF